jgi:hypothetical protein
MHRSRVNHPGVEQGDITAARVLAQAAVAAGTNFLNTINSGGAIAPAATINWDSNTFTPKVSGNVLVMAGAYVQTSAVDVAVTFSLVRDRAGTPVTIGPAGKQDGGHVAEDAMATLIWIDAAVSLAAHTWSIVCAAASGTVTVPAANQIYVVLLELP